jgi:2'-5' RNA ligase
MKNQIRAFIALELDNAFCKELSSVQKELKNLDGDISWINPDNFHLSISFLGNILNEQVPIVEKLMQHAASKVKIFPIALGALGVFPHISSPKVIWAGIGSGYNDVTKINNVVCNELTAMKFKIEDKHFYPHITLARVKSFKKGKNNFAELIDKVKPRGGNAEIRKLVLYKSELDPKGAIYTKISDAKLGKN